MPEIKQVMFAVKAENHRRGEGMYFREIQPSMFMLNLYPAGDDGYVYTVEVGPHEDQTRDNHQQQYWGWLETGENTYSMIYPTHVQFSMCFPYGYEIEEKSGKGKACRLEIREISRKPDKRFKKDANK